MPAISNTIRILEFRGFDEEEEMLFQICSRIKICMMRLLISQSKVVNFSASQMQILFLQVLQTDKSTVTAKPQVNIK